MAIPESDTANKLLSEAPGPSPWWCYGPIPSTFGMLTWNKLDKPPGFSVLTDSQGLPRLALPMYVWFQVLDEGWMLLWTRKYRGAREVLSAPIVVHLLNIDHLRPMKDIEEWLAQEPATHRSALYD